MRPEIKRFYFRDAQVGVGIGRAGEYIAGGVEELRQAVVAVVICFRTARHAHKPEPDRPTLTRTPRPNPI